MKKLLITGFDPFGKEQVNPSYEAIKNLPDVIAGVQIIKLEIPTVFHASIQKILSIVEAEKPDYIISVGQAGGRVGITPERVAINLDDARIPDNMGNQPLDVPIYPNGANAYFSNLPIKAMTEALLHANIPASLSNSAGTFVCNHVMYGVLYHIHNNPNMSDIQSGFIHVPFMDEQVQDKKGVPSLPITEITRGLQIAIETVVSTQSDNHTSVLGSLD